MSGPGLSWECNGHFSKAGPSCSGFTEMRQCAGSYFWFMLSSVEIPVFPHGWKSSLRISRRGGKLGRQEA